MKAFTFTLHTRLLVAFWIGTLLFFLVYFHNASTIDSQQTLLETLKTSRLQQINQITSISTQTVSIHDQLLDWFNAAYANPDQEQIDRSGQQVIDRLHNLKEHFNFTVDHNSSSIQRESQARKQLQNLFDQYVTAASNTVETLPVDPDAAQRALQAANHWQLELEKQLLLFSDTLHDNLAGELGSFEQIMGTHATLDKACIFLLIPILMAGWYFSRALSRDLLSIYDAMIQLSKGNTDIKPLQSSDTKTRLLIDAVYRFKQTLLERQTAQNLLEASINELSNSNKRYFQLLELIPTGVIVINQQLTIVIFNQAAEKLFGYSAKDINGKPLDQLLPECYRSEYKKRLISFLNGPDQTVIPSEHAPVSVLHKDGHEFKIEVGLSKLQFNKEQLITATITNVTEKLLNEEKMRQQAYYDPLTGVANRFLVLNRLTKLTLECRRNNRQFCVLYLDLDGFKRINDSRGHDFGDKVLVEIAKRLKTHIREGDTVGRLGGDEFLILLPDLVEKDDIEKVAHKLVVEINLPIILGHENLFVGASIGIAIYGEHGDSDETLLKAADAAMYRAKQAGKNQVRFARLAPLPA